MPAMSQIPIKHFPTDNFRPNSTHLIPCRAPTSKIAHPKRCIAKIRHVPRKCDRGKRAPEFRPRDEPVPGRPRGKPGSGWLCASESQIAVAQ
jgi:hypothetical protein